MKKKRFYQIYSYAFWILIIVIFGLFILITKNYISKNYIKSFEDDLHTKTMIFSNHVKHEIDQNGLNKINEICDYYVDENTFFSVILPNGKEIGWSQKNYQKPDFYAERPEVKSALSGEYGKHTRYNIGLKETFIHIAIPIKDNDDSILCAVRGSSPTSKRDLFIIQFEDKISQIYFIFSLVTLIIFIAISNRISSPLKKIIKSAKIISQNKKINKLPEHSIFEIDELSQTLNTLSLKIQKNTKELDIKYIEQQAVLASMQEGVLAIDKKQQIIQINRAAISILEINNLDDTDSRIIQQHIRFSNLQNFIKKILLTKKQATKDMTLNASSIKSVQVTGSPLTNEKGVNIGALIVMRDITDLRKLEEVRTDFVANVSHELKTPITSIKGFIETLSSDDFEHNKETKKFLEIIRQQSNRLNTIVDDLLTLSRIERKEEHIVFDLFPLENIIKNSIALCHHQAEKKNIKIKMNCDSNSEIKVNSALLEQALVNLIINAIQHSNSNTTISLIGQMKDKKIIISVQDEGIGIEKKHHTRLFERFYRIDSSRSRNDGGTGLGLSIVKHIVNAHKGEISLESEIGKGSIFTIKIPIK
ncbi:MAG: hypothetical protein CMF30_00555 [Kiritimatiellaceae bacterium]|nr:hypothetical protein [Kiritimatiellaceae bacterium]